ncbi:MAG: T9SS type A sorting domain-containing protein [Candidatus Eisenbacteria sp.]|nr:T9SS type A sorting domain-containing protein [Candidatus Eisenbacteria bacterium]
MKRRLLVLLPAVLLGLVSMALADEGAGRSLRAMEKFPDPSQFELGSREWFRIIDAAKYRWLLSDGRIDNCPHSFDVLHYNIAIEIDFANQLIYGDTRVISMSEEADLSQIDLDFTVLTVDAVMSGAGDTLSYAYSDPVLTIDLGQAYAVNDSFEVRVVYHGHPGNEGGGGFGGFYFEALPQMAYQMGVGLVADPPSMGKFWFPCWDWPCDKATAEYHITVPGTVKKAVCNGTLVETAVDTLADKTTYVWLAAHEMAPHVMMVAARKFTEIVDSTYDWIHYWVFPPDAEDALIHFQNVDIMMDGFIQRYGPYPFDKFGYVSATRGDMEHQTCVTHNGYLVGPHNYYDWLLAHEMAHQWWGDCVSVNDWRDLWLSEGFATYSEAIYQEHAYGMDAYHDYMQDNLMHQVLTSGENFPIYDPEILWGTTSYEKGGCVLHMLRHVIGDSVFFDGLAAYRQAHEYESATTPQFQQAIETVSGQDLDWFFDEWIYDRHWPEYEYSWQVSASRYGYSMNLAIDQVQTTGPVFAMPVEVGITTVAGDTLVTLWVDEAHELFRLDLGAEPTAVDLDPANWILDEHEEVAYTEVGEQTALVPDLRLEQNVPNPFNPSTTIRYSVPGREHVRLEIFNATGQRVACLLDERVPSGWGQVVWNGRDDSGEAVASGMYFCRLTTDAGCQVRRVVLLR